MPSSRSTVCSTAAKRAKVSRLPSPASIRSRVLSVSSKVMFPELPDASMDTRKPIAFPQCSSKKCSPTNFLNHRRPTTRRQRRKRNNVSTPKENGRGEEIIAAPTTSNRRGSSIRPTTTSAYLTLRSDDSTRAGWDRLGCPDRTQRLRCSG